MFRLFIFFILLSFSVAAQHPPVIFTKQINNNDNFYVIDDKGVLTQFTDHPRKDSSPMLSPDGKTLVFTSERVGWWKIWSMDIEKKTFQQLTNSTSAEYSPCWSPNGEQIAFISSREGGQDIFVMNRDGSDCNKINVLSKLNTMPFWGSDNRIYFSSKIKGTYQITSCSPDGSYPFVFTKSSDNKLMPQISNDGKQILYYGDKDGNLEIYILNLPDMSTKRLTNHPLMDMRPRWSPDNKWIVFERGNKGNNHHIYIMRADGSDLKQLTFEHYNYAPSFVNGL